MELSNHAAQALASMAELTDKKDTNLSLVYLRYDSEAKTLRAVATDKYIGGVMTIQDFVSAEDESFEATLNADAVKFIKQSKATIRLTATEVATATSSLALSASDMIANYWKGLTEKMVGMVAELVQAEKSESVAVLDLAMTTKIAKVLSPSPTARSKTFTMSLPAKKSGKPTPVLFQAEGIDLVQQPRMER